MCWIEAKKSLPDVGEPVLCACSASTNHSVIQYEVLQLRQDGDSYTWEDSFGETVIWPVVYWSKIKAPALELSEASRTFENGPSFPIPAIC